MTPEAYCQEKAAASGSSFYYSFLFLPDAQKKAMTAVYAFCREVDDIVDECKEPDIARAKLAWWHTELEALYRGTPTHPISRALAPAIQTFSLPKEYFETLIQGMQMDLDYQGYETFEDLELYCYRVAGVVGLLSAHIFGHTQPQTLAYAKKLGLAFQMINILRDCGEDAFRGRIYFPTAELSAHQITENDILTHQQSKQFERYAAFWAQRTRQTYQEAMALLPSQDQANQRAGLAMANIYLTILDVMQKDNFQVLKKRYQITPIRKLWIAWRTMRRYRK